MVGLMVNIMGFIAQAVISALVINNQAYYDEPRYGVCAFCYKLDECRTSYKNYIASLVQTAKDKGMVLSASSVISFSDFFHRNMTPGTCSVVTAIGMITISVLYFMVQLHFLHIIKQ
jgi:hypothetical protein